MCEICSKKFPSLKSFQNHRNRHAALRDFTCHICQKKFSKPYRLNNHIENVHSEKLYDCTICAKAFATVKRLKLHTDKHLVEKPSLPCTFCQKVFRSAANLEKHLVKCENAMRIPMPYGIASAPSPVDYSDALNLTQSVVYNHRLGTLDVFAGHAAT